MGKRELAPCRVALSRPCFQTHGFLLRRKMTEPISARNTDNLVLSPFSRDRIRSANYYLLDYVAEALRIRPEMSDAFGISRDDVAMVRAQEKAYRVLMGTPFLVVAPSLTEIADWQALIHRSTTTVAVDNLARVTPQLTPNERHLIYLNNRTYIWLLVEILNTCALAAPVLGISTDLAAYLATIPQHTLDLAISDLGFPIFRWRVAHPSFLLEYGAHRVGIESVAHFFMQSSPIRLGNLQAKESRHDRGLRNLIDTYAAQLIGFRCRAASVVALLGITSHRARAMYQEIHGVSSPCGQAPSSLGWHLRPAAVRVQSTVFLWLYKAALAGGSNVPEALISAYDFTQTLFGQSLKLEADRAYHLVRVSGGAAGIATAPCRACGTHYLIANNGKKVEFSGAFACPSCGGLLGTQSVRRRGRAARAAGSESAPPPSAQHAAARSPGLAAAGQHAA